MKPLLTAATHITAMVLGGIVAASFLTAVPKQKPSKEELDAAFNTGVICGAQAYINLGQQPSMVTKAELIEAARQLNRQVAAKLDEVK